MDQIIKDIIELVKLNNKIVVFTKDLLIANEIQGRLQNSNIESHYIGSLEGRFAIDIFNNSIKSEIIIGIVNNLVKGFNLKEADWLIFVNSDKMNKIDLEQAECRANRLGREKPLYIRHYNKCCLIEEYNITDRIILPEPKEILTPKEKKYLENLLRPFKDRVECIRKRDLARHFIVIQLVEDEWISLPYFEKGKYYKGMEPDKNYTIAELGLFNRG